MPGCCCRSTTRSCRTFSPIPNSTRRSGRRKRDWYVEAVNHALRGIPPEKVRFHTCYGINEGPRIHEAALTDVVGHMLKINADAYSFEAANARHEHEYHLWETVKLPDGKIIIPGVITHASNIVEHPELIAERITRFAKLVGRENVIPAADCGFSSQASYKPEVHPKVMWTKFAAWSRARRSPARGCGNGRRECPRRSLSINTSCPALSRESTSYFLPEQSKRRGWPGQARP